MSAKLIKPLSISTAGYCFSQARSLLARSSFPGGRAWKKCGGEAGGGVGDEEGADLKIAVDQEIREILRHSQQRGWTRPFRNLVNMGSSSSKEAPKEEKKAPKEEKKVTHMWNRGLELDMTEQGAARLVNDIKGMLRPFKEEGKTINILVFGPTGCGKSSLLNGLRTALKEQKIISKYFAVGTRQDVSYTKNFHMMTWEGVTLFDMAGVFESSKIKSDNIVNIVQGKVPFTGEFDDFLEPKQDVKPQEEKHISCVVLVLKPGMELADNLKRILEQLGSSAGAGELAYHMVLTHVDEVEHLYKDPKNLGHMFQSQKVQSAVKQMSDEIGIPPYAISFVRNYAFEAEANPMSNVLLLHTFRHIVNTACEQEEKRETRAAYQ